MKTVIQIIELLETLQFALRHAKSKEEAQSILYEIQRLKSIQVMV